MANHRLTGMLTPPPWPVMPVQTGIQDTIAVMPTKVGIQHWIPAFAGMTTREHADRFDAARREAARLAADTEDMAALEQTERRLEGKGRGKKRSKRRSIWSTC